jgi:hypothetical protein
VAAILKWVYVWVLVCDIVLGGDIV